MNISEQNTSYNGIYQVAWDNTSLSNLRTCPRKYYYANVRGLRPKGENPHLVFGLLYHQALEKYDFMRADEISYADALHETIKYTLTASANWHSEHKTKNRQTLVRAVFGYLDHFRLDPVNTYILSNGKPAVELSFRFEIDLKTPFNLPYILSGHLDKIGEMDGNLYVFDRKTSSRGFAYDYIASFKPSGQMMQYTVGSQVAFADTIQGVMIDAVHIGTNLDEFFRFPAQYTKAQLDEWFSNTKFYIKMAEQYAEADHYPQNFEACHVYQGCPFREICSRDPSMRETVIRSSYIEDRWEPLKVRDHDNPS